MVGANPREEIITVVHTSFKSPLNGFYRSREKQLSAAGRKWGHRLVIELKSLASLLTPALQETVGLLHPRNEIICSDILEKQWRYRSTNCR